MRNLRNKKHSRIELDALAELALKATAWDPSDDSLVIAQGPSELSPVITIKRLGKDANTLENALTVTSWDAPSPNPDLAVDSILNLHCFPDTGTLNLVLEGGDIVVVSEDPQPGAQSRDAPGEARIEIVGSIDAGIQAAAWSPDEELLAVATGANTLLLMTREFDTISNITFVAEDIEVSNHVSVGWGKKETQFKGRGVAKALRDPTVPEHVDEGILSTRDDGKVTMGWRGDGHYVAVNSILDTDPKRRVIRVYSREGVLESVSEPVNGLEGALSWKPSGQIIAGVRRRDDELAVVFFERNGLRHGEFSLRLAKSEMETIGSSIDLSWNVDSTVLAVSLNDRVQLWTMGNHHYYLKQEIRLPASSVDPCSANTVWHPEKALQLCCFNEVELHNLSYDFEVCRGSVTPPHDIGLVAVIDGKILKVTPLRSKNIPPPMAFDEIELPDNALDVTFKEDGSEIAVLHHETLSLWTCNYAKKPMAKAALKRTVELCPAPCTQISEMESLHIHTNHDRISYSWENDVSESLRSRIPVCTSYVVTHSHLIYTTAQHLLKFVHLLALDGQLEIPRDEPETDERCRSIERGANIVTVIPSAHALILQMPRGNLETIYPRALVLAGVRQSLRNRDYKTAFLTCRAHRVDMNILHDYAPEQFLRNIELFVKEVDKVDYIDIFLSSLSDDNVSETMYRETLAPKEKPVLNGAVNGKIATTSQTSGSKINKICDAFLGVLQPHSSSRLQNIVTAHVCKNPPDFEAGLRLISEVSKQASEERLEQAVEHICFLADVNQLYDTALGLYDLDVALLVAQQSQKDPREYLPYLQELYDLQPLRQRFKIDNDLKRYQKALSHLHGLGEFEELKQYTCKHDLYAEAIDFYRYHSTRLTELVRIYADYLTSRNRYEEAGIAYESTFDHSSAYEAYRAVTKWRECLSNAALVPLSSERLLALAQDLAASLEESKDYRSAATIYVDYLADLAGSARLLCKGYHFTEAMRQVTLRQKPELLQSVIDPGLTEASGSMTELLAEMKTQLAAQVPRLHELRQKRDEDPMAFLDGAEGGGDDVPDDISLAPTDASTSGETFMTRYTNASKGTLATDATRKTSKNRRREERKRARGKKGTVYEEEYLVNSIARLVERLNDVAEDTSSLIESLMRRSMRERAIAVQSAWDEVRDTVARCMDEVFEVVHDGSHSTNKGDVVDGETQQRPWGGQGVLWDALTSHKQLRPVLKKFERLALIP